MHGGRGVRSTTLLFTAGSDVSSRQLSFAPSQPSTCPTLLPHLYEGGVGEAIGAQP